MWQLWVVLHVMYPGTERVIRPVPSGYETQALCERAASEVRQQVVNQRGSIMTIEKLECLRSK